MKQTIKSPLRVLFAGEYEPEAGHRPMAREESAIWDKAQTILGEEMIDKMLYAQSRSLWWRRSTTISLRASVWGLN